MNLIFIYIFIWGKFSIWKSFTCSLPDLSLIFKSTYTLMSFMTSQKCGCLLVIVRIYNCQWHERMKLLYYIFECFVLLYFAWKGNSFNLDLLQGHRLKDSLSQRIEHWVLIWKWQASYLIYICSDTFSSLLISLCFSNNKAIGFNLGL